MSVPTVQILALDERGPLKLLSGEPVYRTVRLGRRPPSPNTPAPLRLSRYLSLAGATPPPAKVDYWSKAGPSLSRMYLNDQYGDCVIASKHHGIGVFTGNDAAAVALATDNEVYQQYQTICGPGDNGCVITEVLDYWKSRGLTASGVKHTIDGYVSVDWRNKLEVQIAIYLFGHLSIGINLPSAWANGASPGGTWDVTATGIVGGHDVAVVGYDEKGVQISTWGITPPITITWAAFTSSRYLDECYAVLSPDWYGSDKVAPMGLDAARLIADLATLGGGSVPNIDPPAPPPVPPVPPYPPVPPVPPVPPPAPQHMSGFTASFTVHHPAQTVTGTIPGLFSRPFTVTIPARDVTVSPVPVTVSADAQHAAAASAIPWATILDLVAQFGAKALPVILADIRAGKSLREILADVVAALAA